VEGSTFVPPPWAAIGVPELDADQIYPIIALLRHPADARWQLTVPGLARRDHQDSVYRGVTLLGGPWAAVTRIVHPVEEDPHVEDRQVRSVTDCSAPGLLTNRYVRFVWVDGSVAGEPGGDLACLGTPVSFPLHSPFIREPLPLFSGEESLLGGLQVSRCLNIEQFISHKPGEGRSEERQERCYGHNPGWEVTPIQLVAEHASERGKDQDQADSV
jgi:hypothetical protein